MVIDGIKFNKEAMSLMSFDEFKKHFGGRFSKTDIDTAAKLLNIKKVVKKHKKKATKEEE